MTSTHHLSFSRAAMATLLATTLSAGIIGCSSSDGGVASTTIDGTVFASAVDGAACTIEDVNGNIIVDNITTVAGDYSANIPDVNLTDPLVLVCNGGTYTNEADGSTNETAGMLAAYADANTLAAGTGFHATPDSTIMHQLIIQHQMTLADAEAAFEAAFGYTPDNSIAPTDATAPDAGATHEELLAGLHAATFSQLALDLGLTAAEQFNLMLALAEDLSDGTLDGSNTTGIALSANIQNQFTLAMMNFRDGGNDASGLDNSMIGILPFAQTAITASYTVEYLKDTMGMMEMEAMEGKSQFQVRITNNSDSTPATGLAVTLMPMMHMATMTHTSPVDNAGACIPNATAGTYDCTVYYLMASAMMDGSSMGYWDLKVMVAGEAAHFFPPVMMAMNGTAKATLKNNADQIYNMMMDVNEDRTYSLFKSDLTSNAITGHDFELFIAAKETMMSFPAVDEGTILNTNSIDELTLALTFTAAPMTIEASTDPDFLDGTEVSATNTGNGYWTATGITGLTNDIEGDIYIRMTINGTQYTTDGIALTTGPTSVAKFTVTPSMPMP